MRHATYAAGLMALALILLLAGCASGPSTGSTTGSATGKPTMYEFATDS